MIWSFWPEGRNRNKSRVETGNAYPGYLELESSDDSNKDLSAFETFEDESVR